MLRSFFRTLINWLRYATGSLAARLPCSGYDETAQLSIAWGAAATEHPCCIAPAADFARDDVKIPFHGRKD